MPRLIKLAFATFSFAVLFCASAGAARATVVTFSTSGSFNFGGPSITFGTGADTVTLTFVGAPDTTVESTPEGNGMTSFGQIRVTVTGAGATIPTNTRLDIRINQSGPQTGSTGIAAFLSGSITETSGALLFFPFGADASIGPFPIPRPFFVYTFMPTYGIAPPDVNGGVTDLRGTVAHVPEPATMVLLGTGLAGVAAAARRRRRKA